MKNALRSVFAVVAGFVVACVVMVVVEMLNGHVLYPELGKLAAGVTDREVLRQLLASAPVGALLVVLAGWALAGFVGGIVAAWIGSRAPARHALVLGAILTLAGIANNLMLPPPAWFWIVSLLVFIPFAYAGAAMLRRRRRRDAAPRPQPPRA